jgi:hypothetical protein
MVASGKDVRAEVKEIFRQGGGQAEAARSVLRINDDEIDLALPDDVGQMFPHDAPARTAENVPDEEQFHKKFVPFLVTIPAYNLGPGRWDCH